jgi:hypothetical protein
MKQAVAPRRRIDRQNALLHSPIVEDLRFLLLHWQKIVAGSAIVGNRQTVRAGVRAVVATEAAGKIVVSKLVEVKAPGDLHLREDIAQVDAVSAAYSTRARLVLSARAKPSLIDKDSALERFMPPLPGFL